MTVKNTLINESGLGVIFNSKLSKNFFDWKEHKLSLFLNNTGNQYIIKSVFSFSFNPNISNFSSRNFSAFSSDTINPSFVSCEEYDWASQNKYGYALLLIKISSFGLALTFHVFFLLNLG